MTLTEATKKHRKPTTSKQKALSIGPSIKSKQSTWWRDILLQKKNKEIDSKIVSKKGAKCNYNSNRRWSRSSSQKSASKRSESNKNFF